MLDSALHELHGEKLFGVFESVFFIVPVDSEKSHELLLDEGEFLLSSELPNHMLFIDEAENDHVEVEERHKANFVGRWGKDSLRESQVEFRKEREKDDPVE